MNLVKIGCYASGYYSDSSYSEEYFITEETYNKVEKDIKALEISIYELDGKHSECEAEIECESYTEEKLIQKGNDTERDGRNLYYDLENIFEEYNLIFEKECKKVEDYLSRLDANITFKITVKKSQRDRVLDFIKTLK